MTSNASSDTTDPAPAPGVLLDLDGTLVDSVYQHVVAWHASLREAGYDVTHARVHAGIGMGSDRLVPWLLGDHVDDADELADDHKRRFLEVADTLRPTPGARELLRDLELRGVSYMVATSAGNDEREALLTALGREDVAIFGADDVATSKPAPDLLLAACAELGVEPSDAVMVGDAPWDAAAAARVGLRPVAVRCGGFGDAMLREAGAFRVVDAPRDLIGQL